MKKLFMLFAAAAILGAVFTAKSYALTTDNAYVVVRCTVSVAVEVQSDATAAYFMGADGQDFWEITRALTVGTTEIATNAIQVRNTSVGAITKWKMKISAKEVQTGDAGSEPTGWENDTGDGAWTVGTSSGDAGPLIIKLYAAFKSAVADAGDFAGAKELPNILTESDKDYQSGTAASNFSPAANAYSSAIDGSEPNFVNPHAGDNSTRNLYIRVKTPTAVADELARRYTILITAGLPSAW